MDYKKISKYVTWGIKILVSLYIIYKFGIYGLFSQIAYICFDCIKHFKMSESKIKRKLYVLLNLVIDVIIFLNFYALFLEPVLKEALKNINSP